MLVPGVAVRFAPTVARALTWTRAQGALLDVAATTLVGCGVGRALGHARLGAALGATAGVLLALRWRPRRAALAIQRARPALGLALEAYLEGGGGTLRPRLERWLVERTGPAWLPASFAGLAAAAVVAVAAPEYASPAAVAPVGRPPVPVLSVTAHVEPPAYTGRAPFDAEPPRVRSLRHSLVRLEVRTTAERLRLSEKGGVEQELLPVAGRATLALPLDTSRSLRLAADGGGPVVLLELEAVPDEVPRVTLEAPDADRSFSTRPGRLELRASAQDDVAVARLGFRWTLAQGHGEGMRFLSGGLAGRVTLHGQTAEATTALDPVALGMKAGDTLVVWAEAADGNTLDGPGLGRSDARILRWDEALVDFSGAPSGARLPPPSSQLSERELLARTERLVHSGATGPARREKSAQLSENQRHLRESFGFFLQMENRVGVALDVDDAELGESGDARARKLLAQAVSEMWTAEAELAVGNPAGALAPERAAVKALDAAFGNERIALHALRPPDKPVDEGRRLSGAQAGLSPRASSASLPERPDTRGVETLARRLLLAAELQLTAEAARALADAVWALPADSGIPVASLAAPLYAAKDEASRSAAAREVGVALARWLLPSPEVVPPVSSEEGAVLARIPLPPLPP
jgi:hypothetical protein